MRGITYTIRSSLYVAVTNRCCTTSLIASRGPGLSMPPSFHPLPVEVEPSAADVLGDVTRRLDTGTRGGPFDEIVLAGVGEPLLRWSLVKEVVTTLRSRHQDLLRVGASPANAASAAEGGRTSRTADGRENDVAARPTPGAIMPIRLVTNGLWPAVAYQTLGSCCPTVGFPEDTALKAASEPKDRGGGGGGGGDDASGVVGAAAWLVQGNNAISGSSERATANPVAGVSAASIAREVAELFDSVSVALNTADPAQYEELMKPSVQGSSAEEAHALVCDLVKECVAQGLPTECTVVARDEVDVGRAQELAAVLGASCRVRPHFP